MSDELRIPSTGPGPAPFTHTYRTRRSGVDGGTRPLLIAAGALGSLLLVGFGAWSFMGHRGAGTPVVEADTRPLRLKPENPGGMQVIGANEQIMGGASASRGADMAPAAEAPDPQALRAQMQPPARPGGPPAAEVPQPAPGPAASASAPVLTAPAPAVSPLPDTAPRTTRAAASSAPHARPAPSRGLMVQLAAVGSERTAHSEWERLQKRLPDLLEGRRLALQHVDRDGKAVWRIRIGGFADVAEATAFCTKVRAKHENCSLASF